MRKFLKSFVYAAKGVIHAAATGRNMRIHICAAAYVLYFALKFYALTRAELAVLILTIGAVLSLETLNTSVERLADYAAKDCHPLIAKCKDCAAGAVLISAAAAVFVGIAILWDSDVFAAIYAYFSANIPSFVLLILSLILSLLFVIIPEIKSARHNKK